MGLIHSLTNYLKGKKQEETEENKENLDKDFQDLSISDEKFNYKIFIEGIKSKKYKKILFLTGAGISVSAGIPDFRSPGSGLYSKLKEYNLPYPEAIFELGYFRVNPKPFYTLSKELLMGKNIHPSTSHFFIKMIYDLGILHSVMTQNIDGLELEAGLPVEKLCQAHGHYRSCHCISCHKKHDIKKMMECIEKQTIYECENAECQGLIKPDIVFFHEGLPKDFFFKSLEVRKADLVIIMGTSLVVMPFAGLAKSISKEVPIVVINRENSLKDKRENFLFLGGDLDKNVKKIVKDLDMLESYEKIQDESLNKKSSLISKQE